VIEGQASADGTGAMCFQPKGRMALMIYRWEVPVASTPVAPPDSNSDSGGN
jgi:hypothetical protein